MRNDPNPHTGAGGLPGNSFARLEDPLAHYDEVLREKPLGSTRWGSPPWHRPPGQVFKRLSFLVEIWRISCFRVSSKKDLKVDMTSPSPLLYDTYYHIYNRGVNGEDIFVEERNYDLFLKLYEKHLSPVTDLFGYCLLKNHFHVSVRIKSEEEILETRKTLRVSPANGHQSRGGNSADREEGQPRKP